MVRDVKRLVAKHGSLRAARMLRVGRVTVLRVAGGEPMMRGTLALLTLALRELYELGTLPPPSEERRLARESRS